MYLDRYILRTTNQDLLDVFSSNNVVDTMFDDKELFGETKKLYSENPLSYNFDYASYHYLVATFTKPVLLGIFQNRELYYYNFIYAKTKDNQAIVDVNTWEELEQLDMFKGPVSNLRIYFILYDNMIKFAVESQYQALPKNVIYDLIKLSISKLFLNTIEIEDGRVLDIYNSEDFDIGIDYNQTDFENIYNNSNRNKKIVFYVDTQNEADEFINSGKLEYSLKPNSILEHTIEIARLKMGSDNFIRYVVKCEDIDGKTASINAIGNDIHTDEWTQPARTFVDNEDIENGNYRQLVDFLGN